MDPSRFDALARILSTMPTRRSAVRLLVGGVVAAAMTLGGGTDADARRRRRKKKRQPRMVCYDHVLQGFMKDEVDGFVDRIQTCKPACEANAESTDCTGCVESRVDTLVEMLVLVSDVACQMETGRAGAMSRGDRPSTQAAASGSCKFADLRTCHERKSRDTTILVIAAGVGCLASGGLGCAAAVAGVVAIQAYQFADCYEDFGCKQGTCVAGDLCCPSGQDSACNGECCSYPRSCAGGTCACEGSNIECGDTCCDTNWCYECAVGQCDYTCGDGQYCAGGGQCRDCGIYGCGG